MFAALALLASVQASPPLIECVSSPDFNCNTGVYSGPPITKLYPNDLNSGSDAYMKYWTCHWSHVQADQDFGSSSAQKAISIFQAAISRCLKEKNAADLHFDQVLKKQPRYGDDRNRLKLRESFRREGEFVVAFMMAGRSGNRNKLIAMMEAITALSRESSEDSDP